MKSISGIALIVARTEHGSCNLSNVRRLDAQDIPNLQKLYKAEDFDFRLKPGSAAVDRGVALPNVTDGFSGRSPDLGALEVGAAVPHYGPRP